MRLSFSYRRQGVGLTKRFDILREAAVIFDVARRGNGANESISTFRRFLRVDLHADIYAVIVCSRFFI